MSWAEDYVDKFIDPEPQRRAFMEDMMDAADEGRKKKRERASVEEILQWADDVRLAKKKKQ